MDSLHVYEILVGVSLTKMDYGLHTKQETAINKEVNPVESVAADIR